MFPAFEMILADYATNGSLPARSGRRTYRAHVLAAPPATADEIAATERALGHDLSSEHRAFLARWNGARLFARDEGGGVASTPVLFGTDELSARREECGYSDDRLLLAGKLDDEAFLFLDRREPQRDAWPVRWADECDSADEILAREPIAASIDDFVERFARSQGEWYWVAAAPLAWVRDTTVRYELWRHGLGLFVMPYDHPSPCWRIGVYGTPAVVPETALIVAGLTDELVRRGGVPVAAGGAAGAISRGSSFGRASALSNRK